MAVVDLDRIEANARWLAQMASPALLCAVVKADAYGHGAVPVARAALRGGASWLAVAVVEEGVELREAGIDAPVLVLSEADARASREAIKAGLVPTLYSWEGISGLCDALAGGSGAEVALKLDTGMGRVGADPAHAVELAAGIAGSGCLRLGSVWTHLAVADDPEDPFTCLQLGRFDAAVASIREAGINPGLLHAANSAGSTYAPARYGMVRCGIALYGYAPSKAVAPALGGVRPALSLRSEVSLAKVLAAGERPSYGRRRALGADSRIATVPVGYADGVPWRLFPQGEVLIGGRRRPLAGSVTMDQVVVDCGPASEEPAVSRGDEVVLLGRQGGEEIDAADWAAAAGTITYEMLTGIGARVARRYVGAMGDGDGAEAG